MQRYKMILNAINNLVELFYFYRFSCEICYFMTKYAIKIEVGSVGEALKCKSEEEMLCSIA